MLPLHSYTISAGWFECFPDPPINILARVDALLEFHDADLVRVCVFVCMLFVCVCIYVCECVCMVVGVDVGVVVHVCECVCMRVHVHVHALVGDAVLTRRPCERLADALQP